jgi:hypothetical protein
LASGPAITADRVRADCVRLQPVAQSAYAFRLRAMRAAEHGALLFDAMPEDVGSTVRACGGNAVNGAFEAVEGMRYAIHHHLKCLVVIVSAGFTSSHGVLLLRGCNDFNAPDQRQFQADGLREPAPFLQNHETPADPRRSAARGAPCRAMEADDRPAFAELGAAAGTILF